MKIVPISKHEYKIFPIDENDNVIEITEEEFNGLERLEKCFNDELTAVIDYVKTEEELAREARERQNFELKMQISVLKSELSQTDYKTLKLYEGEITEEEYAETRELRKQLRKQINELEAQIVEV